MSLLTACGGSQPPSLEERSATGVEASSSESVPPSEDAALTRAAALNAASLEAAEQRALAAEADVASTDLDTLPPGQPAPKSAYTSGAVARKALAVAITAYRFYNTRSGAHFYTVNEAERDHVRTNLSPPFSYEGEAFQVANAYAPGLSPVHRFFNTRNGVHFYTISEAERAHVAANLRYYTYEGVAYHASEVAGGQLLPFHRFFVPSKGFHFYTASEAEKNHIIANLGATYRYEGVGYYVLDAQWNAEKLPHTGVTTCYRADSHVLQACNEETAVLNPLQDGDVARTRAMDFGPLRNPANGQDFPYNECVLDKVTGLLWEGKNPTAGQARYGGALFTNLGNGAANDASGHVAAVNASRLCGYSDWRMPSLLELQSLVDYGRTTGPLLNYRFLFTIARELWSSDLYKHSPTYAWFVSFDTGGGWSRNALRTQTRGLRLVRGAPLGGASPRFTFTTIPYGGDAANNVANDAWTGLQWRRCEEGRTWNGTSCAGGSTPMSHEAALYHARQQAGWRLPNVRELASLPDPRIGNPDPAVFPNLNIGATWASSPYSPVPEQAWGVDFFGTVINQPRSYIFPVRLLRTNGPG